MLQSNREAIDMTMKALATLIIGIAILPSSALADPLQFNFTSVFGSSSNFSFIVDNAPVPDASLPNYFILDGVAVTIGGGPSIDINSIYFYTSTQGGGLASTGTVPALFGDQIFDGPTNLPQFLTGSYDLHSGTGFTLGTLTIGAAANVSTGVPEPSTWAMMLLGFGAIGLAARR